MCQLLEQQLIKFGQMLETLSIKRYLCYDGPNGSD